MMQSIKRRFIQAAVFSLSAGLCLPIAHANDEAYPNRPIKFVVPYTAGGSNDVVGRVLAQKLSADWGVPIIVENRAGAGGNLGAALRSEEHTSELQSLMRISYAVFRLKKKTIPKSTAPTDNR